MLISFNYWTIRTRPNFEVLHWIWGSSIFPKPKGFSPVQNLFSLLQFYCRCSAVVLYIFTQGLADFKQLISFSFLPSSHFQGYSHFFLLNMQRIKAALWLIRMFLTLSLNKFSLLNSVQPISYNNQTFLIWMAPQEYLKLKNTWQFSSSLHIKQDPRPLFVSIFNLSCFLHISI